MKQKIKTLILLTGLATATMHIINRIEYSRSTSQNILAYSKNNYYEWRFGKIRYVNKGNGAPILLLHDLTPGSSLYEFNKIVDELSKTNDVYAIDLLGYGLSDKPNMTYTNYFYVQLITDFIKNIIGKKTDIISTGDSVPISIMACHNNTDIINRIVAINPQNLYTLNQIPSKRTKLLKMVMDTPIIGTFIYNIYSNKTCFEKIFKTQYFYNKDLVQDNDIQAYWESSHLTDYHSKHNYTSYKGKYTNANIIHALKEINNSIYIIAGKEKNNIKTTIENYEYYNNAIETVYIPQTKHLVHLEKPNEVINNILTFLN